MESIQNPVSQLFKMCSIYCSGHTPMGHHAPDCKFILLLGLLSPNPCHMRAKHGFTDLVS